MKIKLSVLAAVFSVLFSISASADPRFPRLVLGPNAIGIGQIIGDVSLDGTSATMTASRYNTQLRFDSLPNDYRFSAKMTFSADVHLRLHLSSGDEWEPVSLMILMREQGARLGNLREMEETTRARIPVLRPNQAVVLEITVIDGKATVTFNGEHAMTRDISPFGSRVLNFHTAGGTVTLSDFTIHAR